MKPHDLVREHSILSAVIGSHAYGLATEESDVDRRGVYAAPTASFWRFAKPPTSVSGPEPERLSWEVEHFCALALKANPTVLELLAVPELEVCTTLGEELRTLLPAFLSRRAAVTYVRATDRQLAKASAAAERGEWRWKLIMHSIRLMHTCHTLLVTGSLVLHVGADRDRLLAVRSGELGWDCSWAWAQRLRAQVAEASRTTSLPSNPDTARVERWLVSARARVLRGER